MSGSPARDARDQKRKLAARGSCRKTLRISVVWRFMESFSSFALQVTPKQRLAQRDCYLSV